jgi:hypothetical protein
MAIASVAPAAHQIGRCALVVVLGLAAIASARAEEVHATLAQRLACTPDAWRLCASEIPDAGAVRTCMIANKARLSPTCRAVIRGDI